MSSLWRSTTRDSHLNLLKMRLAHVCSMRMAVIWRPCKKADGNSWWTWVFSIVSFDSNSNLAGAFVQCQWSSLTRDRGLHTNSNFRACLENASLLMCFWKAMWMTIWVVAHWHYLYPILKCLSVRQACHRSIWCSIGICMLAFLCHAIRS